MVFRSRLFLGLSRVRIFSTTSETAQTDLSAPSPPGSWRTTRRENFYQPTVRGTARSPKTQNQLLVAVKNLFAFLREEGLITHDPAAELHYAREPQTLPRNILTPSEARRVNEAADTGTLTGYRDRTLFGSPLLHGRPQSRAAASKSAT